MDTTFEYYEKGKPKICEKILRSLPDWFGIEESTLSYIDKSKELPMITAFSNSEPVGFISIKQNSPFSSEIYVMGVSPNFHRKGLGKELVRRAEKLLSNQRIEFLQVKTVDSTNECEFYKKTRLFYKAIGFKELEVFPTLWDENNPCLILIKSI